MNKTATPKKTVRRSRSRRKKSGGSRFRSWWALLLGGLLIAGVYVAVLYFFFVTPLSFRWRAMFGETDYPEGEVMGIDISHYQATIDWERLRNAKIGDHPVSFVIIKGTEGELLFDDNFNDNFFSAKNNELIRGAYHFFVPDVDPRVQAKNFNHKVFLEPGDLPPILDVESRGKKPLKEFQKDVLTCLRLFQEKYGVPPILYTGKSFKRDYLNAPEFDAYPLWIAHYYEKKMKYEGAWVLWQYTDCGKVDGIKGFVDFNLFNGDMKALMALTIPHSTEEPTEE